jgi:phosphatidate cytidylyltransferase
LAIAIWQVAIAYLEKAPISQRAITSGIFAASYLPLLASFLVLLLSQHHGNWRVALLVLLSVANDTGGYFAGVLFGKHPMAPTVSPKKSWEGFIGSVALTTLVGILGAHWVLGLPFMAWGRSGFFPTLFSAAVWLGLLIGLVTAVSSTLGDLSESLLKRDLGIKDMGHILPGHGGVLDRVDSILFTAPFVYLLFSIADRYIPLANLTVS